MRTLISNESGFTLTEAPEPVPARGELLVRVVASSVSPRDLRLGQTKQGFVAGADFAGVVECAASRKGPQEGQRVAGVMRNGAWAARVAVAPGSLSQIPDDLEFAEAAAISATGLTSLYALEKCGSLVGKKVLITAANGNVGGLACQMAKAAGASATGLVRDSASAASGRDIEILSRDAFYGSEGSYHYIIDMVGGDTLAAAVKRLRPGGRCVVVGNASGGRTIIDAAELYMNYRELVGFALFSELEAKPASDGLARLFHLWGSGRLQIPHCNRIPAEEFTGRAALRKPKSILVFS